MLTWILSPQIYRRRQARRHQGFFVTGLMADGHRTMRKAVLCETPKEVVAKNDRPQQDQLVRRESGNGQLQTVSERGAPLWDRLVFAGLREGAEIARSYVLVRRFGCLDHIAPRF